MTARGADDPNRKQDAPIAGRVDVSLLSHTNVGKTTLARTLLREDIGEVGDRAHVTEVAESHVLIESAQGDSLVLWDTPGFGDSARVLKRLRQGGQPVGWFLSQVWDRFADRPFWCSQQAMHTAREHSDVILYVVNAGEAPSASGYVNAEMRILGWIGKPVLLLLNQMGPPRDAAVAVADVTHWQAHVTQFPWVEVVLPFDAFARCWVQEGTLLAHVQRVLPAARQPSCERLRQAWRERNLAVFRESMQALSRQVAVMAFDSETIVALDMQGKARAWLGAVATGSERGDAQLERAQAALAARIDAQIRDATQTLVQLHGLTGKATDEVLTRMGGEFAIDRPADPDKASVLGGLLSGALGGLAADLGAGGLTFGAGALIGGVLGAFGGRGIAKAYNLARGAQTGSVRWSTDFLLGRIAAALIRYLAVAHFGRGRGEFTSAAVPAHWHSIVTAALEQRRSEFEHLLGLRSEPEPRADELRLAAQLLPLLCAAAQEVLIRLYPDCADVFR
ncbi:MAG TPA: GTPase [Steroidobacteraceae bacterium]